MNKPEREELRRQAKAMAIQMTRMTLPIDTVFDLLNALDKADERIAELEGKIHYLQSNLDEQGNWIGPTQANKEIRP